MSPHPLHDFSVRVSFVFSLYLCRGREGTGRQFWLEEWDELRQGQAGYDGRSKGGGDQAVW